MKFFLVCVTTTLAISVAAVSLHAFDESPAGETRLSDETDKSQPVPHVIGSDEAAGQATLGGDAPPVLPQRPAYLEEPQFFGPAGPPQGNGIGYRMSDAFTVQYRIDHNAGGLQGYDDGYTNIGAFIPVMTSPDSLFFTDVRGVITNNSDGGFNLGLGRRQYDPNGDRVWSSSIWYDLEGGHSQKYHRLGWSGSMTSRYWRYRFNGYKVVGDQSDFIGSVLDNTPFLSGDEIHLNRTRTQEVAYSGFDATVGGPMPLLGQFGINWDSGIYYNAAKDGKNGLGFMFSSDAQLTEDVNLAVKYNNDNVFGASAQMSLAVNLPDGRASRILRQPSIRDYMLRSDVRNYRVNAKRNLVADTTPLLNATDGLAMKVANIIPADTAGAAATGDGTIETPFNGTAAWNALTGAEKAEFDIVLVRPGTIPTGGDFMNNLNSGITIVENQRLLASTGRLVRTVDTAGTELYSYGAHTLTADVAGLGTGLTFTIPGTDSLAGTVFDPLADPRPILSNHTSVVSTRPHAVVTIDNSFAVACDSTTEVSGFIVDGTNPNMSTMPNNGIVTGNILDPALGTGVTGFDINSNLVRDTVHGVHITSLGTAPGTVLLNRIEGDGFNSNSGINVYHSGGALSLRFEDNLAFNIFGEDIDNDGAVDVVATPSEDVNGNGKLDFGEDLDGDGTIDVSEDNDKDGVLGDDDIGIAFNIVSDGAGSSILANDTANSLHIIRNVTHLLEAEYSRQQTVSAAGIVSNAFTAKDINGDVDLVGTTVVQNSDTEDNVGNKNGMNLEARAGGTFSATVQDNDTSFNNPYAVALNPGDNDLFPPVKNPFLANVPTALGNEFGFRARATGAGSVMTLSSPDRHLSNSNFGHGAILEALDGSTLTMTSPMQGAFTTNPDTGAVTGTTPSQYNDNGLNGLYINGNNNSILSVQVGDPSILFNHTLTNPADQTTRSYLPLNQFLRNGQDGIDTTSGNGIEVYLRSGATFAANSNSGIFHATVQDNLGNGVLIDVENTTFNDFTIHDSQITGNLLDGILASADTTDLNQLRITDNVISNNARNGINFQLLNSDLNNSFIENNLMDGNGTLVTQVPVSNFQIDIVFGGGLSASQQAIFQLAANRWAEIILGDVPDVGAIDDLEIVATGEAIDGVGGTLGSAGPSGLRAGTNIPFAGSMRFDTADLADLEASGQLQDVILHEMGHVLGFGTVWAADGFLLNPSNSDGVTDTRFTGPAATAEHNARFGVSEIGVPVENTGGPGTADGHWRESIYTNELMTGFLNAGVNPITRVTTAQLQDLGYVVNFAASDPALNAPATVQTIDLNAGFEHATTGFFYANATPNVSNLVTVDATAVGNGINISMDGGNLGNAIIENNIITNSTGDGIRFRDPQFASNNEGDNQIHYRLNTINSNAGFGINMSLNNANHLDAVICANDISSNTLGGVNVELIDSAVYHNGLLPPATLLTTDPVDEESWFFGNTINNNGGIGYGLVASDDSSFTIVGSRGGASTVNGNQEAGIGIEMNDNVVGNFSIDNININNNADADAEDAADVNTNFDGDGIGFVVHDNATLNNLRIGDSAATNPLPTNISANQRAGVNVLLDGNASLVDATVQNATISNNGTGNAPATGEDQRDNIHVNRGGIATLSNFRINNVVANNAGDDGIDLIAQQANHGVTDDHYIILNSEISNNANRGISSSTRGDAEMILDIGFDRVTGLAGGNVINNNGVDGIQLTSIFSDPNTDEASVTGIWTANQINNNGGSGVLVAAAFGELDGIAVPLEIGRNGADANGVSFGNEISNNTVNGIHFFGGNGTANVVNNRINNNGGTGIVNNLTSSTLGITDNTIAENGVHGIDINAIGFGTSVITVQRNTIEDNTRDGIQLLAASSQNMTLNITDNNQILNNAGRGIDLLTRPNGSPVIVQIDNATISGNDEEGIYAVLTNSATQGNEVASTTNLLQNGTVGTGSSLDLSISNSTVSNNGTPGPGGFISSGVVLRVGTGTLLNLSVDDNTLTNNTGLDFLMHTFTSTVDPNTILGNWTDQNENPRVNTPASPDLFSPSGGQPDPLASITVNTFSGNTGGSADVFGTTLGQDGAGLGFAFYDNNEPIFKSRTRSQDNATDAPIPFVGDDDGPFSSGTRRRNATRQTARTAITSDGSLGTVLPPGYRINGENFQFSGVGDSTLRRATGISLSTGGNVFTNVTSDFTDSINITNNGGISSIETDYFYEEF